MTTKKRVGRPPKGTDKRTRILATCLSPAEEHALTLWAGERKLSVLAREVLLAKMKQETEAQ